MISLSQLAVMFEDGLNGILNNKELKFKIWADAGEYKPPVREGNSIIHEIVGNLRISTSANDATDLVMGVNGLSLDFIIPVLPPRTNSMQTEEKLAKIKDGQYPFVKYITNAINSYFQKAAVTSMRDERGFKYSVSFQAGTATSGTVALRPKYGNSIDMNVFIEVYFGQGSISSKSVKVYLDDSNIPFQTVRQGRTPVTERDVYAGTFTSRGLHSSSAFAIDISMPAWEFKASEESLKYLSEGKPNVAHFVNVVYEDKSDELYFMMLNDVQTSVAGISFMGITASLIEVAYNSQVFDVPENFQITRFNVGGAQTANITFTLSAACLAFVAGAAHKLKAGSHTFKLTPDVIEYDESNKGFYVYLITDKAENITSAVPVVIVKGGRYG